MDFQYKYTDGQEQFRLEVTEWLEANLPDEIRLSKCAPFYQKDIWNQHEIFRLRLGEKKWLAPTLSEEWGGGAMTTDHARILHEELQSRGLGWLLDTKATYLTSILEKFGTDQQKKMYLPPICRGDGNLWHSKIESDAELDRNDIGVKAFRDGDDYLINGEGLFAGHGPWPSYLWVLASTDYNGMPSNWTGAFIVPANLQGVRIENSRNIVESQSHIVIFENVWVPAHCLIGADGDGWSIMQTQTLDDTLTEPPVACDQDVAALFKYASETIRDGIAISNNPVLKQLLVEAFINSQVSRLFSMRNAWMAKSLHPITYENAQATLWNKNSARRLARIARDVLGIYALLNYQDPRAPSHGRLEFQQRQSLTESNQTAGPDVHLMTMAKKLGLGTNNSKDIAAAS